MGLFKKNKTNYFFDQFSVVADYAEKCAEELKRGLLNFPDTDPLELKNSVHAIEHQADQIKHETEERLAKEFMTPIDREDIFLLLDAIDDLTDSVDDISYKIYVRNYKSLPEKTHLFLDLAVNGIKATVELIHNLDHVTDKSIIDPLVDKIRMIEEETDKLYEENVHTLYEKEDAYTSREIAEAEDIYGLFEYITDKCRDVTKEVDIIMYKNL